ncbi:DUF6236 family protein [Nocardia pneumoniae]|uniref:DUF6236 family protein n=1 Tax=Nocardia pneumoniae TaxID=228601 RepID=UPI0012F6B0C6|nr:DUF6236 family protein [Nocardia pneumoniae]
MSDVALYYPHLWIRDETWLKSALLHWPRIARMVPRDGDYEYDGWARDPEVVGPWRSCLPRTVHSTLERHPGILLDIAVTSAEAAVAGALADVVDTFADELRQRYGIAGILGEMPLYGYLGNMRSAGYSVDGLEWVHEHKMVWTLSRKLVEAELAVTHHGWMGMHPKLAAVYMCSLAERLAQQNRMATITDEQHLLPALNDWSVATMAAFLLDDIGDPSARTPAAEVGRLFTLLAVTTVIPKDLANIPLEQILKVRERLLPRLLAYRKYLDTLADTFADLATVNEPAALQAHLGMLVRSEIEPLVAELESNLRSVGFQPMRSVLGVKALTPSALIAAAVNQVGLPPVVSAGSAVAACLVGATADARHKSRDASDGSPVAYLVSLKRDLSSKDVVSRARAFLHRR